MTDTPTSAEALDAAEAREQAAVAAALRQKAYYARMLDEARREEREACEGVARWFGVAYNGDAGWLECSEAIAAAIRARGEGA